MPLLLTIKTIGPEGNLPALLHIPDPGDLEDPPLH